MPQSVSILNVEQFLLDKKNTPLKIPEFRHLTRVLQTILGGNPGNVFFYDPPTEEFMAGQFRNKEFASLTLSSSDEKKFLEWIAETKMTAIGSASGFLGEGYKLSVSWVVSSNAFCLSVIGTDDCSHNKDVILTNWSDDLEEVFLLAAYKHIVLADSGEWPTSKSGNKWG